MYVRLPIVDVKQLETLSHTFKPDMWDRIAVLSSFDSLIVPSSIAQTEIPVNYASIATAQYHITSYTKGPGHLLSSKKVDL